MNFLMEWVRLSQNKYVHPKGTEKKFEFSKIFGFLLFFRFPNFFSVPFGCTYFFGDNLTHTIKKFTNFRTKSIHIPFSDDR